MIFLCKLCENSIDFFEKHFDGALWFHCVVTLLATALLRCYACTERVQPLCVSGNATLLEKYTQLCKPEEEWCVTTTPKSGKGPDKIDSVNDTLLHLLYQVLQLYNYNLNHIMGPILIKFHLNADKFQNNQNQFIILRINWWELMMIDDNW